jgi:hypothetical protein
MTWIVGGVIGGVIFIVVALVLLTRGNDNSSKSGQTAFDSDFEPEVTGAPQVAVLPQDAIDYGDVKLGTTVNTEFKVRNVGDKPLVVIGEPQVEVIEGC